MKRVLPGDEAIIALVPVARSGESIAGFIERCAQVCPPKAQTGALMRFCHFAALESTKIPQGIKERFIVDDLRLSGGLPPWKGEAYHGGNAHLKVGEGLLQGRFAVGRRKDMTGVRFLDYFVDDWIYVTTSYEAARKYALERRHPNGSGAIFRVLYRNPVPDPLLLRIGMFFEYFWGIPAFVSAKVSLPLGFAVERAEVLERLEDVSTLRPRPAPSQVPT